MIRTLLMPAALLASGTPQIPQTLDGMRTYFAQPTTPFRILGNIYYVGTQTVPAYLVTTPEGHILIDGTPAEGAPLVAASIRRLGFRVEDVRYLLINHAHWDHAGGLAELKRLTGARLIASRQDTPLLAQGRTDSLPNSVAFPPVKVDRRIGDGDVVELGGTTLMARLTPGHTKGCTSWTMDVSDTRVSVSPLRVLFACSLSVGGQPLVGNTTYPRVVSDYQSSFKRLRRMSADVFLAFHAEQFDLAAKRARLEEGDRAAFVDHYELPRRLNDAERAFADELARQRGPQ